MLEQHIEPFLESLKQRRYARMTIRICQVVATEFVIYLYGRVGSAKRIGMRHLRSYLAIRGRMFAQIWGRPIKQDYRERLANALKLFLRYLKTQGIQTGIALREPKDFRAVPGHQETLAEYEKYLVEHKGLSASTVGTYLDHASRLCRWMIESRTPSWDQLAPETIYDHIRRQARRLGHTSLQNAQSALRCFFRFLRLSERTNKALENFLVRYRTYRLSKVPQTVTLNELYRLFEDVQGSRPSDIRDRAILLLLTLYGLRIGEIVRLSMEDVRWREQHLVIRRRKAGRDLVLPLHPAVARALWEYVDQARPRGTPYRQVFLSRRHPHPYPRGSNLAMTLKGRLRILGLHIRPHALRHSLASHLINNDCPPEWIQALLGHTRFSSTQIYAKVDLAHLREVAELDWAKQ